MLISGVQKKKIQVSISVSDYERLKALSEETGRTVPGYIRWLVKRHLLDLKIEENRKGAEPDV